MANIHEEITEIQAATKRGELPRDLRMVTIEQLTEEYYAKTGEMPDGKALERLADLCLYEELTDDDRMKMRNNEYPIMSNEQLARRQEGFHSRGNTVSGEVPLEAADTVSIDGRSYGIPSKRQRNTRENNFVDKKAKIRNKERKRNYAEFTKVQPVITYKIR
jgi:hypothetical protein